MTMRLSQGEILQRFHKVHGDAFDYTNVRYQGFDTNVEIRCKKHDIVFLQTPARHIKGCGCHLCASEKHKCVVCGVGVNDLYLSSRSEIYQIWIKMLQRCYLESWQEKAPTYKGCSVCDEWLKLSNFKSWVESPDSGFIHGHRLDKDILVKRNKIYSPGTCCFVPQSINTLLIKGDAMRGKYPIGVHVDKRSEKRPFKAQMCRYGHPTSLGNYATEIEAFEAYKNAKEIYIKELAEKYFSDGLITEKVYKALLKYEVDIND